MSYTVPVSFDIFFENINLSGDHREIANSRRERLISLLEKEFTILESFSSGSIPRYTAVKGYADLDIIVALHYAKHIKDKKPSQVLKAIRDCLGDYRTNVRRNGQAVTMYYNTWPNVDIVPVAQVTSNNGSIDHYEVPDMNSETWISSRPKKHSETLSKKNVECGDIFKKIIKMIKWWNHQHSSLLQSYHIEVMAINMFQGMLSDFPWQIYQYFDKAIGLVGSSLWYELSYVDSYLDSGKRLAALDRLKAARDKSRDAWYFTYNERNEHEKAINLWRQIFGDEFPAYGS
jgi:hypothetical protein